MNRLPVFDLDGTLLDSDAALVAPFVALGIAAERVGFGMTLAEACDELGVSVDDYLAHYDPTAVKPFPGVAELIAKLDKWAVFSNKRAAAGEQELRALGWEPDVVLFVESFGGPKSLGPVLDALELTADAVVCVGDSEHDRQCARTAGVPFALAGWNPRATPAAGDIVLGEPGELLDVLGR